MIEFIITQHCGEYKYRRLNMRANSKKIAVAMARACIDPKQVAMAAGISYPAARRVMDGKDVKPSTLGKIAIALGVNAEDIIEFDKED